MAKATGTQFTVQGPRGWSRPAYGSFAGKAIVEIPGDSIGLIAADAVRGGMSANSIRTMLESNAINEVMYGG